MKLAYIYQEGTNIKKANIYQAYSMVKAFSASCNVDWYRGSKRILPLSSNDRLSEKWIINLGLARFETLSRLAFCFHTLILLSLSKPDVIFTRDFAFIYFYSKLPRWSKLGCPIVFESHKIYHRVSGKVSRVQELSAYSVVDQFVCVSEGIKEDLSKDFDVHAKDIFVAPSGIEKWKKEGVSKAKSENDGLSFIYAGSYGKWKGVDTILEASFLLDDFTGHIYIVGVENEILDYNENIVTVLPPMTREDLYRFYTNMDVGIVPTLNHLEGTKYTSPIKFFEYAYAGLDILSSDLPSTRELQSRGFSFQFFEVGNTEDLARKLTQFEKTEVSWIKANYDLSLEYTWDIRANNILDWI